ncbi:MAG: hypothetical protein R2752_01595 [Vicinamibacterales bacterium]
MPSRQLLAFQIGCWAALVSAAVHLAGHIIGPQPTTPAEATVLQVASNVVLQLPGASRSLMDLFSGFSLALALFLAFWGGLGLMLARRARHDGPLMYAVARTMAGAAVILLVISLTDWFIVPSVCIAMMAISFAVAAVRAPDMGSGLGSQP